MTGPDSPNRLSRVNTNALTNRRSIIDSCKGESQQPSQRVNEEKLRQLVSVNSHFDREIAANIGKLPDNLGKIKEEKHLPEDKTHTLRSKP